MFSAFLRIFFSFETGGNLNNLEHIPTELSNTYFVFQDRTRDILDNSLAFLVCTRRHGGHVGVQNDSEKSPLGI